MKSELAQLSGRRAGLEEGQEKLAEGICPLSFRSSAAIWKTVQPKASLPKKLTDLDQTQADLTTKINTLTLQVVSGEATEKELHGLTVRLQELDKRR